jgi:hypothetical protein
MRDLGLPLLTISGKFGFGGSCASSPVFLGSNFRMLALGILATVFAVGVDATSNGPFEFCNRLFAHLQTSAVSASPPRTAAARFRARACT